jgi:GAF domain-containing protein
MEPDSTSTAVLNTPDECQSSAADVFPPLAHATALEFQATLQLLVERARFLTAASSVAIALPEGELFVYGAASGDSAPEAGTEVDASKEPAHQCIEQGKAARAQAGATEVLFTLAVPIIRDEKVAGFFELRGHCEFEDCDIEAVTRLAEMVSTAVDHRNAAMQAESRIFEQLSAVPPAVSSLWHAPDSAPQESSQQKTSPAASSPAEVHKCGSCGFPVSYGRKLCVDCEQKTEVAHPPAEILTTPAHESWISAHGYTIASLLVTALTFAIIYWLRR